MEEIIFAGTQYGGAPVLVLNQRSRDEELITTVVQLCFLLLVELSKIIFPFVCAVAWHFVELMSEKIKRSYLNNLQITFFW